MNAHDPIFSEVYSAPKASATGEKPSKPVFKGASPHPVGASALSPNAGRPNDGGAVGTPPPQGAMTPVAVAALAEPSPASSRGRSPRNEPVPLFETNSIGGRRRIAQSSSFNKLMMNVLGE